MDEVEFWIALSTAARPGDDPAANARHIEELGFDLLSVSDHLTGSFPTFETWTVLTWAAAAFRPSAREAELATGRFAVRDDGIGLGVIVRDGVGRGCVFYGGCAPGIQYVAVGGVGSVPGTNSALMYFPQLDATVLAIATSSESDVEEELVNEVVRAISS